MAKRKQPRSFWDKKDPFKKEEPISPRESREPLQTGQRYYTYALQNPETGEIISTYMSEDLGPTMEYGGDTYRLVGSVENATFGPRSFEWRDRETINISPGYIRTDSPNENPSVRIGGTTTIDLGEGLPTLDLDHCITIDRKYVERLEDDNEKHLEQISLLQQEIEGLKAELRRQEGPAKQWGKTTEEGLFG